MLAASTQATRKPEATVTEKHAQSAQTRFFKGGFKAGATTGRSAVLVLQVHPCIGGELGALDDRLGLVESERLLRQEVIVAHAWPQHSAPELRLHLLPAQSASNGKG